MLSLGMPFSSWQFGPSFPEFYAIAIAAGLPLEMVAWSAVYQMFAVAIISARFLQDLGSIFSTHIPNCHSRANQLTST